MGKRALEFRSFERLFCDAGMTLLKLHFRCETSLGEPGIFAFEPLTVRPQLLEPFDSHTGSFGDIEVSSLSWRGHRSENI